MKYIPYIVCMLLLIAPAVYADADVDAVQLNRQNGETVVKIDASSHFQFTHQIEEAKDGRPFRVIVDLFPAVHKLGQKSFYDLPSSMVKAIRTSQYAVQPNKTVRVVLDLNSESVYRIEKKGNAIYIYIPDTKAKDFPAWVSTDHIKPAAKPVIKSEKSEKPAVQAKAEPPVVAQAPKPVKTEKTRPETTYFKPDNSGLVEKDWSQPLPTQIPSTPLVLANADEQPVAEKKVEPKPEKAKAEPVKKSVTPKKKETKEAVKKANPKTEYVSIPEPEATQKNTKPAAPVVNPNKDKTDKVQSKAAVTPAPKPENPAELVVEEKPEPEKKEAETKKTAHFRRQPAFPAKLKGTIVAEFPKRMVIKYKPGQSRDPFASLIDESKGTDSPLDKKIPDVETARLVGVLESTDGQNRALLEDLDGYGFILKPGDKVKKGYVSQIYTDKALFQIFEYGWSRSVALHLDDNE